MLEESVAPSLEESVQNAKSLLLDLLRENSGCVSARRIREELESQQVSNPRQIIAHLKFPETGESGEEILFHHYGRSFYSAEAYRKLNENTETAATSAESNATENEKSDDAPRPRAYRREEARLGRYVLDELNNIYATDFGPNCDYVFDVHSQRPGSDFENVDLIAVHWRSDEIVEVAAVEVKLEFTGKLIQQANNYRRFADRVWIAVPVDVRLVDAASVLREIDPLLFEYTIDLGLGILACRRAVGRSYEVGAVHWPRRLRPDSLERAEFLDRFRPTFEEAGVLAPKQQFPRIN